MEALDRLLNPTQKALKASLSSFVRLETADSATALVSSDGSLVSYVRIDGTRQIIGDEEYARIVESATIKIGARFDRPGHALQVYFARDPKDVGAMVDGFVGPARAAAGSAGLDMEDMLDSRAEHMRGYLACESAYFVLWTRPVLLTQAERKRASAKAVEKRKKWTFAPNAQYPYAALDELRTRHTSFVTAITTALSELGLRSQVEEVHEALRAARTSIFPDKVGSDWRPCLPGDPIPPRAPTSPVDKSDLLWPNLGDQLASADARTINKSVVRIGNMLWAAADMTLAPMDPSSFDLLMRRFVEAGVPFRISFLIEGGGAQGAQLKATLATMLSVTNAGNKQVKYSLEALTRMARREPVVRLRVSFATWCRAEEKGNILNQLSVLTQAVEGWGYCQVSDFSGDPLECVMSSALGIHCASTAPMAVAPMYEVMKLLPWQRPSSPFDKGALILRTPDGKPWPYQTGTNLTTTWFDLIFAQPGGGKSVLLNTQNLATCLTPGLSKLPYVAVIDIGPSSSGLISLIKEALPPDRQHEAAYYRLQMSHQYAINPFDTQLGCRTPLPEERSYLVELLTLLCTPPGHEKAYDGVAQLAGMVVDEMYRWRADTGGNAEPRPYLPRLEPDVDEALRKYNVHLPADPYWWDIVDKMFDLGNARVAELAQRHAVPILGDTITAARRPQIRSLLEETSVGSSAESVINAFERMVTSAIRELPILASVTQFDIAGARLCALDLMDVAPQGDASADRQTSIMYMLARHALVRSWWMSPEAITGVPERYREHHTARLQEIAESPKRLCYDEFHRTSTSPAVRAQIIRDVREGRKRGVQIVLASQLLGDFSKDMVDLATGVWVLGTAVSDKAVEDVADRFGLSATATEVVRNRLSGPTKEGGPCLLVLGTNEGRYEQYLLNTLGPVELWALSTSMEDVAIRGRLYVRLGAGPARRALARAYPGGSARDDIRRRVLARSEDKGARQALIGEVIGEIVEELIATAQKDSKDGEGAA